MDREKKRKSSGGKKKSNGDTSFRPGLFRYLAACRECGVPLVISRAHEWQEDGRILTRNGSQRLVVVEVKLLNEILKEIAGRFGAEYHSKLVQAKAFDSYHYVRALMSGRMKFMTGYPLAKRPVYRLLCEHAKAMGLADAGLRGYRRGRELVIRCSNCYNPHLFKGDIVGGVCALEDRKAEVELRETSSGIEFHVFISEGDVEESIGDYNFAWEVPLPGYVSYRRCKSCGVPFPVTFLSWDVKRGVAKDTRNGEPVTLLDVAGINVVYEEMRRREGEWVDDFIARRTKEVVDKFIPRFVWKHRRVEERIRDLFFLAYRGMGNPVFTQPCEGGIRTRVENPFNYPIVAGITASFLARGKPVTFRWEKTMPGRLELTLTFL